MFQGHKEPAGVEIRAGHRPKPVEMPNWPVVKLQTSRWNFLCFQIFSKSLGNLVAEMAILDDLEVSKCKIFQGLRPWTPLGGLQRPQTPSC